MFYSPQHPPRFVGTNPPRAVLHVHRNQCRIECNFYAGGDVAAKTRAAVDMDDGASGLVQQAATISNGDDGYEITRVP